MTADLRGRLRAHPFCEGLADEVVDRLAACASDVDVPDGALLLREGGPAPCTLLVEQGRVAVVLHDGHTSETIEAGDPLGWSWWLDGRVVHFDARAVGPVRGLALDGGCLARTFDADPAAGLVVARRLLEHATRRLERARLQSADVFGRGR